MATLTIVDDKETQTCLKYVTLQLTAQTGGGSPYLKLMGPGGNDVCPLYLNLQQCADNRYSLAANTTVTLTFVLPIGRRSQSLEFFARIEGSGTEPVDSNKIEIEPPYCPGSGDEAQVKADISLPNLRIAYKQPRATIPPTVLTVQTGAIIPITLSAINSGAGTAGSGYGIRIFLKRGELPPIVLKELFGTPALPPMTTKDIKTWVKIPVQLAIGNYSLCAQIDFKNKVAESNEADNHTQPCASVKVVAAS